MFADGGRWAAYGLQGPAGPSPDELGLGGRSYLAYHPPPPYVAMAIVLIFKPEGLFQRVKARRI